MKDGEDRPVHARYSVLLTAKLHYDGVVLDCEVLSLSDSDAGIRTGHSLVAGSAIMLKIHRLGVFLGRVRRQEGDRVGIMFLEDAREVGERIRGGLSGRAV